MTFKYLIAYIACLDPTEYCSLNYINKEFNSPGEAYDYLSLVTPAMLSSYYNDVVGYDKHNRRGKYVDISQLVIITKPS